MDISLDPHLYIAEYGNESAWNITIIVIILVLIVFIALQLASASLIDDLWNRPIRYLKTMLSRIRKEKKRVSQDRLSSTDTSDSERG